MARYWGGGTVSDRPGVRFMPGLGRNFLAGAGVLILAGAGDFWSRFGAESDLLKLKNYLKMKKKLYLAGGGYFPNKYS